MKSNNQSKYTHDEISSDELIRTFKILFSQGLINQSELQYAVSLSNERYKRYTAIPMKQL